ncbi:S8 family peptidase [Streptomyces sp. NPDC093109]|uniref:S8 family peptidase n=1 Tax=Streptomyces sp. NPDC093109 TaxID=3154977 RepID=UPI00344BB051
MVAALLTAGLATGFAPATPAATTAADPAAGATDPAASRVGGVAPLTTTVVTLITGDRVHVDAKGRVGRVEAAEGREGVRVSVRRDGGATYVVPADAAALVAQGKLDRRLFDVTGLLKAEYDDAHRASLPLIVSYAKDAKQKARAKAAIADADVSVRRNLPAVRGEALTAPKDDTADVWHALTAPGDPGVEGREVAPGIEQVWLDGKRKALLDRSVPQIGAPAAWQAGFDGTGVKVAVLDTGVDQTHPDLKGAEIVQKDFSGSGNIVDHFGHGTHVASILAGSGAKSGGKYKGVAPGAKIIDAKVLNDSGGGNDSGIIAGMQWAADQGARIANLSLGGPDAGKNDPLTAAVDRLSATTGVLFVIAAGNEGPNPRSIGSPGSAASALTVGAVDRKDKLAVFSSVGPTVTGALKPDITAPGVDIVAAKAAKGFIGEPAADGYVSLSGTSMATPHVVGAAAILAQQHPDWTGQRIKQALASSAKPTAGLTPNQQGTGRVDLTKAITQTVVSEQTALDFGMKPWPHTNDKPVTKKITYANAGTAPVALDLSLEIAGPKGKPAAAGFFTLGAQRITVPAGGTASVTLVSNTSVGSVDGAFTGAVVAKATDGGQSVRTAFIAVREVESYDLTMKFIDAKGKSASAAINVISHSGDFLWDSWNIKGTAKVRVPKGSYLFDAEVITPKGDLAVIVHPNAKVTKKATYTFDARKAKPIKITAPDSAKFAQASVSYTLYRPAIEYGRGWIAGSFAGIRTLQVGAGLPAKEFVAEIGGQWVKGSTSYNLLYPRPGSMFSGFTHKAAKSELALLNVKIGSSAKNRKGSVSVGWTGRGETGFSATTGTFSFPRTAKTYVSAPKGYTWDVSVTQGSGNEPSLYLNDTASRAYKAKKTYNLTYNVGVFAPSVNRSRFTTYEQWGNLLFFCVPQFSDGAGHLGVSAVAKQRSSVTVDGKKIADFKGEMCGLFEGPPDKAAKARVTTDATRSTTVAGVTTRLVATWNFTTKKLSGNDRATLPLSSLRFSPKLSLASTASAGKKLTVPLTIEGAARKSLKSLAVQVSYDGGKKWAKAPVTTAKDGKKSLKLSHPKKATSVSLKAKVVDKNGNSYEVTIIKAYLLK